ncbi:MotA/TolQ/ExbB proton channel family protein [Marinicella sp. W31]|uniref:MotA/TolQ/ExbB proton channel family protein n=1 Tax=Marinicella sp. W31 TaxID=3023713 RepID=UPI00375672EE
MLRLEELWYQILAFVDMGGPVLWAIMLLLFLMWLMILERLWYFFFSFPALKKTIMREWEEREDTTSWFAKRIKESRISEAKIKLRSGLGFLEALVAISPLMGLFGTVYGMLEVFDIMAIAGTSNARAMAGGVSKATIPTMAGMVSALSGVFFTTYFKHKATVEAEKLEDMMQSH